MKKNMGNADRFFRILVAALFAYLYFAGIVTGIPGVVLAVFGGILLLTSIVGVCPLYSLIGLNTCSVKKVH